MDMATKHGTRFSPAWRDVKNVPDFGPLGEIQPEGPGIDPLGGVGELGNLLWDYNRAVRLFID